MADAVATAPPGSAAPVKGEGIASWVRTMWDRGDVALAQQRRDYWLNYAFFEGEQWTFWHKLNREVCEFPRPNDDKVRLTVNKMQPNLITVLAKLCGRHLDFEVPPTAPDDVALQGAHLADHLLEAARRDNGWEELRVEALLNAFMGGTSAVVLEWDSSKGKKLGTLAADDGSGSDVFEGDIQLSALAITEFTLEPGTRNWRDARWFIMAKALPPAQVQDHYDLDYCPAPDASAAAGPLQRRLWTDRGFPTNVDLTTVFTFYQRPCREAPKGRKVVVVGNDDVEDKPWPFPFEELNLYPYRQIEVPKRWTGGSLMNDARPVQVAFNHGCSMLSEHMKLAGNARLAVPDDSGVDPDSLTNRVAEVILYNSQGSTAPHWLNPPTIPRWLIDHVNRLEEKLDDIMCVHDISRGEAPGDRNSGLALSVLAEKDETPLGLMAKDQAAGWGYIASLALKVWEAKVVERRSATVQNEELRLPIAREWTGRNLAGQTVALVPLESTAPHSKATTQAWLVQLAQTFPDAMPKDPAKLARLFQLPNQSMFTDLVNADVAQAERENAEMGLGIVPGLGDRPFPVPWDDHAVHIAEHNRFRKTQQYIKAPGEFRQIVDMHITAHEHLAREQALQQRELNSIVPGAAAVPQGDEPAGSAVPDDYVERIQSGAPSPTAGLPAAV